MPLTPMADTPETASRAQATPESTENPPRLAQFEASVTELEALVESLEAGDTTLEDALAQFERGITLARQCQSLLKHAELRVDQLLADSDGERVEHFEHEPDTGRANPGA